jgi:hypothetical protein
MYLSNSDLLLINMFKCHMNIKGNYLYHSQCIDFLLKYVYREANQELFWR